MTPIPPGASGRVSPAEKDTLSPGSRQEHTKRNKLRKVCINIGRKRNEGKKERPDAAATLKGESLSGGFTSVNASGIRDVSYLQEMNETEAALT